MIKLISANSVADVNEEVRAPDARTLWTESPIARGPTMPMQSDLPLTPHAQADTAPGTTREWPAGLLAAHDRDRGAAVVTMVGEVDLGTGPVLREALLRALERETRPVVVDLTGVPFMDSTGVHVLVDTLWRLERQNRRLAIVCRPGGQVHRLLALVGLLDAMTVHGSRESAVIGGEDRLRSAPDESVNRPTRPLSENQC